MDAANRRKMTENQYPVRALDLLMAGKMAALMSADGAVIFLSVDKDGIAIGAPEKRWGNV